MRSKEPVKRKLESSKPNNLMSKINNKKKKKSFKKYNAEEENLSQLG
jgi:hypothetical protein